MKQLSDTLKMWADILRSGTSISGESAAETLDEASRALYTFTIEARLEAFEQRLAAIERHIWGKGKS